MGIILLSISSLAAIAGGAGWWYFRRGELVESIDEKPAAPSNPLETSWPPAALLNGAPQENPVIEQAKPVVRALLKNLADSVASLDLDSARYGDALDKHKVGIQKASTLAGIQEIERVLLSELEQMQGANLQYRQQLEMANSKLRQQQEQLERLQQDTGTDFLTKVANRRAFDARYTEEISRAKRYGQSFSLMIIDIDHFKLVNDNHGHLAGDRVLKAMARILDERRRESDFLARYGGEEFVLLLPDTSALAARALAEDIRVKVERSVFRCDDTPLRITISLGVGEVQAESDTEKSLFARIDAALYQAKEGGRNQVVLAETSVAPRPEVGRADSAAFTGKRLFKKK